MNTAQQERIAIYIASGIKPAQIASIMGLSLGRIIQIMKEESFKEILEVKQTDAAAISKEEESLETKYRTTENLLLSAIIDNSGGATLTELSRALGVIIQRGIQRQKSVLPGSGSNINNINAQNITVVNMVPRAIQPPTITTNSKGDIIAIGDRTLAPMTAPGVVNLFNKMGNKDRSLLEMGIKTIEEPTVDLEVIPRIEASLETQLEVAKVVQEQEQEDIQKDTGISPEELKDFNNALAASVAPTNNLRNILLKSILDNKNRHG